MLIFTAAYTTSCGGSNDSSVGNFQVSGRIFYQGQPLEGAQTVIDGTANLRDTTDSDGLFTITDVASGDHELNILKSFGNEAFTERSYSIAVNNDTDMKTLELPGAVDLNEPQDVGSESMLLSWSFTDAQDFREYKLYRHTSSGLDETTGTLVHVSTEIDAVTFTDKDLEPLSEYFYRVYVMNNFGRLGGSNIVSATTLNLNVIQNGNFEQIDSSSGFARQWTAYGFTEDIVMEENDCYEGSHCVLYDIGAENDGREYWIEQTDIAPDIFVKGARYLLSGRYKLSGSGSDISFYYILRGDEDISNEWDNTHPSQEGVWEEVSFEFTIPQGESPSNYQLMLGLIKWTESDIQLWIDNLSLEK